MLYDLVQFHEFVSLNDDALHSYRAYLLTEMGHAEERPKW